MNSFNEQFTALQTRVEQWLPQYFPSIPDDEGGLVVEAARYSLLGGGKRVRPVLLLATSAMLQLPETEAMPFACALEMIHTYSLIHDDLPSMDDDDLRRGRPTCHVEFGEAVAILAGDALLNRAYEVMLSAIRPDRPGTIQAARYIAEAAGSRGMIGGQILDLSAAGHVLTLDQLRVLHGKKTAALLKAAVIAAVLLTQQTSSIHDALQRYADGIGLAFQIQDDILDTTADRLTLGKSAGKDHRDGKPTYVSLLGLSEARRQLALTVEEAKDALRPLLEAGLTIDFLHDLADYFQIRTS
ncbi:MAG: polyprenyl synthetase family protein [Clostridiaceae bacterium]|jgi:geranylgeranyl pyrophosphate synthase|nr:polyprenyl synthetase family protein [Clostridiaceae bacterium]